jgi:multidrug efflux pump
VSTKKKSPAILLCVNLISPSGRYDQLYLSNYATIQIKDALARLKGVGDVSFLGARDYSLRIWLDPEKLASRSMTAGDVLKALREQNVQVAAGRLGQPPAPPGQETQLVINTLGRLLDAEQFDEIIVRIGDDGQPVRVRDVGRSELGAKNYEVNSYLDGGPCATLAVYQLPGSNALATAEGVKAKMQELAERFPSGDLEYRIVYDTTVFVKESVNEVYHTLIEAFVLVFIVVLIFLQDWRATVLPVIDVIVSLVGTFAVMAMMGFSLNNLSMFGLVLAIGIVVDDAIVVVENVERWMRTGLEPREATLKAMAEITGPVIAITLVLSSVFIPTAFIPGISGQFYRQFALTIATSMIFSAVNSLTMAPARAVVLIKPHGHGQDHGHKQEALPRWGVALLAGFIFYRFLPAVVGIGGTEAHEGAAAAGASWWLTGLFFLSGAVAGWLLNGPVNAVILAFFKGFNWVFERITAGYGRIVAGALRVSVVMLLAYAGLMFLTWRGFAVVPMGFIPEQDKGYLVVNAQLPDGASLERSEEVATRITAIARETPGVQHTITVAGFSILNSTNIANTAGMFVVLSPFEERKGDPAFSGNAIAATLRQRFAEIQEAVVTIFGAPPVDGLGNTGGFKLQIQDRGDLGPSELEDAVTRIVAASASDTAIVGLFSSFRANQPQLYIDLDRTQAKARNVELNDIFDTLQIYLGSSYANDFTRFGRNWQVNIQAEQEFRLTAEDIGRLKVRSLDGTMVPLSGVVTVRDVAGPAIVNHYNMYPSAEINGAATRETSSGQAMGIMERLCANELPAAMGMEWTELMLQQILAGDTAIFVFILGTALVFLVLCAQYESWSLPIAILLIVPMCLLSAIGGVWAVGSDNNIFTQIGLVVLIGLAAKNAILVVEFAKQLQDQGKTRREAVVEAAKVRLRPIIMTSLAFILGVLPLVLRKGAGFEMRYALGIAVASGMTGVTLFGLFFTPVFYYVVRWFTDRKPSAAPAPGAPPASAGEHDAPPHSS